MKGKVLRDQKNWVYMVVKLSSYLHLRAHSAFSPYFQIRWYVIYRDIFFFRYAFDSERTYTLLILTKL